MRGSSGVAHTADTPDLPCQLAGAGADLDPVGVQQRPSDGALVDPGWNHDSGQLRKTGIGRHEQLQAKPLEAVLEQLPAGGVTLPHRLEALVQQGSETRVQRGHHGDRRGVVIHASLTGPVVDVARAGG